MKDGQEAMFRGEQEATTSHLSELYLPPAEEVERALDLEVEDREELPGLFRLNTIRTPAVRLAGLNFLFLVALAHNALLGRPFDLPFFLATLAAIEVYALGSWAILWAFFARVRRIHLGTVFLVTDLLVMDLVILYTGGPDSMLWPVFIIRVADQLFVDRGRSLGMLFAGLGAYALLLLWVSQMGTASIDPAQEFMKLASLAGVGAYLVASARIPLGLQERALKAKELILQLEEGAIALDKERVRAEEASLAKSQFLARMSHELRTPMNSVIGFTNVLLKSKTIPPESREADFLSRIRQNGMHLLALINDVLDLSLIEEGKLPIQTTDVELKGLVEGTVSLLEGRAFPGSVAVCTEVPEESVWIRADEARLRQVLINLVGNAMKFTEKGTITVQVSVVPESGIADAIHVRDTGRGIDPLRISHIFHAFEQEDGTISRRHGGSGLGLAISSSLCQQMGFSLAVVSELGKGSTFSILLGPKEETAPASHPE